MALMELHNPNRRRDCPQNSWISLWAKVGFRGSHQPKPYARTECLKKRQLAKTLRLLAVTTSDSMLVCREIVTNCGKEQIKSGHAQLYITFRFIKALGAWRRGIGSFLHRRRAVKRGAEAGGGWLVLRVVGGSVDYCSAKLIRCRLLEAPPRKNITTSEVLPKQWVGLDRRWCDSAGFGREVS